MKPVTGEKDARVNVRFGMVQTLLLSDKQRAELVAC